MENSYKIMVGILNQNCQLGSWKSLGSARHPVSNRKPLNRLAIDKNCGEIEKKYWTESSYGLTLNSEPFA